MGIFILSVVVLIGLNELLIYTHSKFAIRRTYGICFGIILAYIFATLGGWH